jgi:hypothetical protein
MLSFRISYQDLIKIPYFPDTTERGDFGWGEGSRPKNRVTLRTTLLCMKKIEI